MTVHDAAPVAAPVAARVAAPVARHRPRGRRTLGGYWWLALSSVAIAVMALAPYLTASLESLSRDGGGLAANYADRPAFVQAALYVHAGFAGIALVLSPLQFADRLRRRRPRVHRAVGRAVLVSIAISGPAGLVLAPFNVAGPVGVAGFGTLGVLWLAFAALALRAARRRDFTAHRRWAIRTFALTYAGVMLRLYMMVLVTVQVWLTGTDPDVIWDRTYLVITFLCWVPNLLVAEYLLRRRQPARPSLA